MVIYCAHAYGGDYQKKREAEKKIKWLQLRDPANTYVSPIHALGWLYGDMSYEDGMEHCYDLLMVCDKVLVCSCLSKGVALEIEMAHKLKIPVEYQHQRYKNDALRQGKEELS